MNYPDENSTVIAFWVDYMSSTYLPSILVSQLAFECKSKEH